MASAAHSVNLVEGDFHTAELLVSRNAIREKLRDALRLHVGRSRRYSVKELSSGSGVPTRAIEAAMCFIDDENYRPLTLENLISIAKFLGVSFVSHYLGLAGLGVFELMDGQPPLPRVLTSTPDQENRDAKRKRLIRELAALEDGQ